MAVDEARAPLLVVNFDKRVLATIREVFYWEKMRMEIPYHAMEINAAREKLRVLQENVLSVVRDYNRILEALDPNERRLFTDRIRYVDRRMAPGIEKLTWQSPKHLQDVYMQEAHKFCQEVWGNVEEWKAANRSINDSCKLIAESLLVSVEKKRVYDHLEFAEHQSRHLAKIRERFESAYNAIRTILQQVYQVFSKDSEEVQQEWLNYIRRVDRMVEESLRQSVRRSLLELSRVINGDKKTEVVPVFNMTVVLDDSRGKVEMRPTMNELGSAVMSVCEQIVSITKSVPRIQAITFTRTLRHPKHQGDGPQAADSEASVGQISGEDSAIGVPSAPAGQPEAAQAQAQQLRTYYDILRSDPEVVKNNLEKLLTGLKGIIKELESFLDDFEHKYKPIDKISKDGLWDRNKDKFIQRYERMRRPYTGKGSWEEDIQVFLERREEIQKEESAKSNKFLRFDVTPLKQALISHCNEWVAKMTGSLNSLASTELGDLHRLFSSNSDALSKPPLNLGGCQIPQEPGHVPFPALPARLALSWPLPPCRGARRVGQFAQAAHGREARHPGPVRPAVRDVLCPHQV